MEARRGRQKVNLVLIVGAVLAVASGVFFYVKDDVKTGLSAIAGLTVALLTLQVEVLVREGERAEVRSRHEELVATIEQVDWLPQIIKDLAKSASIIENKYRNTVAVEAARRLIEDFVMKLLELERGNLTTEWEDATLFVLEADRARKQVCATSLQSVDLSWWGSDSGAKYWEANLRAISRGVRVERIFVYADWSRELDALASKHASAGVTALRVKENVLPAKLRKDFIIWDSVCAYESRYNPIDGKIHNLFMFEAADIQRMEKDYATVRSLASAVETPTAGNS